MHNVRIERLWVDVTAQVGATWAEHFTALEMHHGLDINNANHIWLLHLLYLPTINQQLDFFASSWNQHRMQIRDGPNRSPADMFCFDMLVHGIRGTLLPLTSTATIDDMPDEELEVYGVDWEALRDDRLLESQRRNNSAGEGFSSWIGRSGPPDNLNLVPLDSPNSPLSEHQVLYLLNVVQPLMGQADDESIITLWCNALAVARTMENVF